MFAKALNGGNDNAILYKLNNVVKLKKLSRIFCLILRCAAVDSRYKGTVLCKCNVEC